MSGNSRVIPYVGVEQRNRLVPATATIVTHVALVTGLSLILFPYKVTSRLASRVYAPCRLHTITRDWKKSWPCLILFKEIHGLDSLTTILSSRLVPNILLGSIRGVPGLAPSLSITTYSEWILHNHCTNTYRLLLWKIVFLYCTIAAHVP